MKTVIENKTNVPEYQVVTVIARILENEHWENSISECNFWFEGKKYHVSKVMVNNELVFLVTDIKE